MRSLDTALLIISFCVLTWSLVYICVHWIVIIYGKRKLHSIDEINKCQHTEGVSIIKPLFGYDPNLKENLESFFRIDYPKFELLMCVGEEKEGPSLPIIQELIAQYPCIDVKIFQGGEDIGPNPKICNMMPGYRNAQYSLIWFTDSTVFTPPETLNEMMSHIANPRMAIVHQIPFVIPAEGFAGYLNKVYFGTQLSRICLFCDMIKTNCVNGASMLVSKHAMDEAGGLKIYADYLAEDHFIGKILMERGWDLTLSTKPALLNPGVISAASYRARVTRWTRLRAAMVPFPALLEPLSECFCLGLMGSISASILGFNFWLYFLGYTIVWFVSDMVLLKILLNKSELGSMWLVLLAWLYRESTTYWCFLSGIVGRKVTWGGKKYQLLLWGKATRISQSVVEV